VAKLREKLCRVQMERIISASANWRNRRRLMKSVPPEHYAAAAPVREIPMANCCAGEK